MADSQSSNQQCAHGLDDELNAPGCRLCLTARVAELEAEIRDYEGPKCAELLAENTQFTYEIERLRAALAGTIEAIRSVEISADDWEQHVGHRLAPAYQALGNSPFPPEIAALVRGADETTATQPHKMVTRGLDSIAERDFEYPVEVEASFALRGQWRGIAFDRGSLEALVLAGSDASPTGEVMLTFTPRASDSGYYEKSAR